MRKLRPTSLLGILAALAVAGVLIYQLPPVKQRLDWRLDFALAYLRGVVRPAGEVPTALPPPAIGITANPSATATAEQLPTTPVPTQPPVTPSPTLSPTPIPGSVSLAAPAWERQDINNCGPASLSMHLRYYGWEGDQFDIAGLLKPQRDDRNVNVEELVYYVRTRVGWLSTIYRVGGDLEILKKLLAAGFPVMIEETFYFEDPFWPNDDLWAAHYNLLTGYDDEQGVFTGQDSFYGADQKVAYARLERLWHAFNHVYIVLYRPEQETTLRSVLGPDWDEKSNRQRALEASQGETNANPGDAFAWFNLGTNLVYFERYDEAASAFDRARAIGLPQRMLRYQFTPFFAYFHSRRMEELFTLTEYALRITPNAEEAMLWHGWANYRDGDTNAAIADFQAALVENPNYADAQYALAFVRENP
jgi:tetratricopeptide (TPR) repeat protein